MASYNLEDGAQLWYMQIQREEGTPSWRRFSELLNTRYGPPLRSNPLGELAACKREGSVINYQNRFEALLPRAGTLSERQKVQLFTVGLQPPLSYDVEVLNPQTLAVAMSLARTLELRNQHVAPSSPVPCQPLRGLLPTPPRATLPPPPTPLSTGPTPAVVEGRPVKRLSQAEMEERRRLGLCFNCNEKFGCGHNRVCQRIFLLDLDPTDDDGDDDGQATTPDESPRISLLAISGVRTSETMQIRIAIGASPSSPSLTRGPRTTS